jgi:hypothetical protein
MLHAFAQPILKVLILISPKCVYLERDYLSYTLLGRGIGLVLNRAKIFRTK